MRLSDLKQNNENPFPVASKKEFVDLVGKLKRDPEFLNERPILYDSGNENLIIGGNKRALALKELGYDEIPEEWAVDVSHYDEEKKRRLMFVDNHHAGVWDMDFITVDEANDFNIPKKKKQVGNIEGEVEFSEYINESNNYVVLVFDNDIDWLSAQTHFKLKTVSSKRANGKPWSEGVGRVLNGANYLKRIKNESI